MAASVAPGENPASDRPDDALATTAVPYHWGPDATRTIDVPSRRIDPWPWTHWHRRRTTPRFEYRQVVEVRVPDRRGRRGGWRRGGDRTWASRVEVRTQYRYRIRSANRRRARVQIQIDAIELYRRGRFLGVVHRIPRRLGRIDATIRRGGRVRFDRDVLLLGGPGLGFELVSVAPRRGGYWNGRHRARKAGMLDLYGGRVIPVGRSRLLRPRAFPGLVPVSLIPSDAEWLYRHDAVYRPYGRDSKPDGPPSRFDDRRREPTQGRTPHASTPGDRRIFGAPDTSTSRDDDSRRDDRDRREGRTRSIEDGPRSESDADRPSADRRIQRVDTERHTTDDGEDVEVKRTATLRRIE